MVTNDPVLRYGEIKNQIALLNNELEFLQPEVLKKIKELAGDELKPVDIALGTYVIAKTKTWTYSPDVQDKERELSEAKKSEQATGMALFTENEQLRFNIKKD